MHLAQGFGAYSGTVRLASQSILPLIVVALTAVTAFGQSNPAIEQSRLFPRTVPPTAGNISPEGVSLSGGETVSTEDESFGAQQILKTEEPIPTISINAGTSLYYSNNVALTHSHTVSDGFFVGEAAASWTPRLNPQLAFQLGGGTSIFRYFETSPLNFESLALGTGLTWTPPDAWGIAIVTRYDFTELLDQSGDEILQDHQFSLAVQKLIVLGRSHAITLGVIGSAGISHPYAEQRDQAGFAIGYHLQLSRNLGTDIGYRLSGYFYNAHSRDDLNQVLSLGFHYSFNPWLGVNGYFSGALNSSNETAFRYKVLSGGGGVGISLRF
jgi:hypothetical protein